MYNITDLFSIWMIVLFAEEGLPPCREMSRSISQCFRNDKSSGLGAEERNGHKRLLSLCTVTMVRHSKCTVTMVRHSKCIYANLSF